jgi:hypothetical protein
MKWGKPRPSIPSRFLMEMRGETERALRAAEAAEALLNGGSAKSGIAQKDEVSKKGKASKAKASKAKASPQLAAAKVKKVGGANVS